jgi:hypothetical protein
MDAQDRPVPQQNSTLPDTHRECHTATISFHSSTHTLAWTVVLNSVAATAHDRRVAPFLNVIR